MKVAALAGGINKINVSGVAQYPNFVKMGFSQWGKYYINVGIILPIVQYTCNLTNPITGTGASGQVAYWSGTNTQTGSNNLFWDATNNRLGIKRNNPAVELDVLGDIRALSTVFNTTTQTNNIQTNGQNLVIKGASQVSYITMFQSTGNLLIQNGGTFTDSGQRLQVKQVTRRSSIFLFFIVIVRNDWHNWLNRIYVRDAHCSSWLTREN